MPLHTLIPIKTILEKGLVHSSLEGIATPFPPEKHIVSGMIHFIYDWEDSAGRGSPHHITNVFLYNKHHEHSDLRQ